MAPARAATPRRHSDKVFVNVDAGRYTDSRLPAQGQCRYPPVMNAIFPSSLFMYSSPLIKACQIVRTTLPKGRPIGSLVMVMVLIIPHGGEAMATTALGRNQR
jgi:hypothetical protein